MYAIAVASIFFKMNLRFIDNVIQLGILQIVKKFPKFLNNMMEIFHPSNTRDQWINEKWPVYNGARCNSAHGCSELIQKLSLNII